MRLLRLILILGISGLAACAVIPTASPLPTPTPFPTVTPLPPVAASPTPTEALPAALRVWLPPQFAPDDSNPGGPVLAAQLAQYQQAHPGLKLEIRLKPLTGPGNLLAALAAAYNAAPAALPDLIALNRDDLQAAAAAGLVLPLDNFLPPTALADYYPFAQTLSAYQGQTIGLPFAADARVLVYRTDFYPTPPNSWTEVLTGTLILPGGEPSGLTLLNEYLAHGGPLLDPSDKTILDTELLTEALTDFRDLQMADFIPLSTLTYSDTTTTWQVFRERRATLALTTAQNFLAENERISNAAVALVPNDSGIPFTLADGWSWALVNTATSHPTAAFDLAAWLSASEQLAAWTQAARVLPPRSTALALWSDASVTPWASAVLTHAQLQPPAGALAVVGPLLQKALTNVLASQTTPFTAASTASQAVITP